MFHSFGQQMEQPDNCVQAGGTVVVFALVCWKRAGPGLIVDSVDLLNWPEDTKEIFFKKSDQSIKLMGMNFIGKR